MNLPNRDSVIFASLEEAEAAVETDLNNIENTLFVKRGELNSLEEQSRKIRAKISQILLDIHDLEYKQKLQKGKTMDKLKLVGGHHYQVSNTSSPHHGQFVVYCDDFPFSDREMMNLVREQRTSYDRDNEAVVFLADSMSWTIVPASDLSYECGCDDCVNQRKVILEKSMMQEPFSKYGTANQKRLLLKAVAALIPVLSKSGFDESLEDVADSDPAIREAYNAYRFLEEFVLGSSVTLQQIEENEPVRQFIAPDFRA